MRISFHDSLSFCVKGYRLSDEASSTQKPPCQVEVPAGRAPRGCKGVAGIQTGVLPVHFVPRWRSSSAAMLQTFSHELSKFSHEPPRLSGGQNMARTHLGDLKQCLSFNGPPDALRGDGRWLCVVCVVLMQALVASWSLDFVQSAIHLTGNMPRLLVCARAQRAGPRGGGGGPGDADQRRPRWGARGWAHAVGEQRRLRQREHRWRLQRRQRRRCWWQWRRRRLQRRRLCGYGSEWDAGNRFGAVGPKRGGQEEALYGLPGARCRLKGAVQQSALGRVYPARSLLFSLVFLIVSYFSTGWLAIAFLLVSYFSTCRLHHCFIFFFFSCLISRLVPAALLRSRSWCTPRAPPSSWPWRRGT